MFRILLVEDSVDFQNLVRKTLAETGEVTIASSLAEARQALTVSSFDLILLDLSLPDGDGMEFFTAIRADSAATGGPQVIFLTARDETASQVAAFSLGADDYVVKPLRPAEFRARVEARLRKQVQGQAAGTALVRGDLRIELDTQKAYIASGESRIELELTRREFKILYHLARHEGEVLTREQLIQAVWGGTVHVLDRTVDTHVYTLRKKLGSHASYIESEVGKGYRFSTPSVSGRSAA